jgi:exodeoxyribonuclease VII small subunit
MTTDITFEDAIAKLEAVVERLESGELSLEESLRCFEEGVALQRRCIADLNAAQQKIERLTEDTSTPPLNPESGGGGVGPTSGGAERGGATPDAPARPPAGGAESLFGRSAAAD